MKYCAHCGNELLDEAVICPKCGCPTNSQRVNGDDNSESLGTAAIVGGLFIPLVGFICGGMGLNKARTYENEKGKKRCVAGLIVASITFVINFIVTLLYSL